MLGYSVSYFLGKEWRNTPLYAQKIIPVLDYLLSNNFTYNDKLSGAFYELVNKYQNPSDLPTESLKELAREMGYDYVLNLLADNDEIIRILVYLLVLIHQLKGSKLGLELVMSLFAYGEGRKNILIADWFKQIPTNSEDRTDVLYWFKTRPMDEDGLDNWLSAIPVADQNLAYQEWITRMPIGGTNDEIYSWYLNIPNYPDYESFITWAGDLRFEEDTKIEEWFEEPTFETDNNGNIIGITSVGEENTFSLETRVDVNKINEDFFTNFDTFIRSYVYPELKRLQISTAVQADMTYIPYSRIKENFNARGFVTGYDEENINKYTELNPLLVSENGQCVWTILNQFNTKELVVSVINNVTGQQQICNIIQDDNNIIIYLDSNEDISSNTLTVVIFNGNTGDDTMTQKYVKTNTVRLTPENGTCVWEIVNPFNSKYIITNVLNISTGQQQMCDIVQNKDNIFVYIDTDEDIPADTLMVIVLA